MIKCEEEQTYIIKENEYDSSDTENTLYEGCETVPTLLQILEEDDDIFEFLKINNEKSIKKRKNNKISHEKSNIIDTNEDSATLHEVEEEEEEEDVYKKYHMEYLKEALEKSSEKEYTLHLIRNRYDYILTPLFSLIIIVLHIVYSLYLFVNRMVLKINDRIAKRKYNLTPKTLSKEASYFTKIPKHISFIIHIQQNDIKNSTSLFNNIKNLVHWSMEVGIPYITFYDYHGFLKENARKIIENFDNEVNFLAFSKPYLQFNCSGQNIGSLTLNNTYTFKNENESQKEFIENFKINFISYEDGKTHLVKITKLLSKSKKSSEVAKMTIEDMNKFILENSGESIKTEKERDPDLIIIFGGYYDFFNLYGYPPWQIRLSEIYPIPGKPKINYYGFINGLIRYSRCQQRIGK
ncbi:Undecaprenyl diphosphate synthase [Anaeromyces robustus]|uniref:ditrans,polycis-polyprenyl diphosphate synthase [(2E,6E)-farnesyldiphosphate specific] n=1 Tax=Anaeromyces robustus TaxID=1754192 RepID=A0A1Y1XA60_9FUNG|nr:Undecaprenyl diphosphate synthase [Anaeromyces robustus]|eukprot:ORX82633.1 Undecaprenyl diphosphate synthase [Anaeromyces robustus]